MTAVVSTNLWYNAENQFIATAYTQTVATDVAKLLNMKVVLNLVEYNSFNTQVINPRVCILPNQSRHHWV